MTDGGEDRDDGSSCKIQEDGFQISHAGMLIDKIRCRHRAE